MLSHKHAGSTLFRQGSYITDISETTSVHVSTVERILRLDMVMLSNPLEVRVIVFFEAEWMESALH